MFALLNHLPLGCNRILDRADQLCGAQNPMLDEQMLCAHKGPAERMRVEQVASDR
jgi:hypothetical protein